MRSVRETVTFLEMSSPDQLAPGRPAPPPMHLEEVGPDGSSLLRDLYVRIAAAIGQAGRSAWADHQWKDELSRPGVRTGLLELITRSRVGAVSEFERALIRLRLQRGRALKAERGGFAYGSPPFGYGAEGGNSGPLLGSKKPFGTPRDFGDKA